MPILKGYSPTVRPSHFIGRRRFLATLGAGVCALAGSAAELKLQSRKPPFFRTRGVVLIPDDLSFPEWPERARAAGLSTISLHHSQSPKVVADFMRSDKGEIFRERSRQLKLQTEYELHAMRELLPRELFGKHPDFFRMNEKGERTADSNLCPHSEDAMALTAENARSLARLLRPTTHRHFFWGDDGRPWCRCKQCAGLSDSDQALLLENRILVALRRDDPQARLAHLAYSRTLAAPLQVKPAPGIFLEFAPIDRRYDISISNQTDPAQRTNLAALDANLKVFGAEHAQVLEYWLDVSRFSRWRKPAVKLPFDEAVFQADLECYGSRGIRHITSFAVFIDGEYVARFGEPGELRSYGELLAAWRPKGRRGSPKEPGL